MRLDQLKGFLLIAETASFRRAAELLNTTQPTLSARIRILEDLLGQRLFDRAARGVRLTQAGHDFRPYAAMAVEALARRLAIPQWIAEALPQDADWDRVFDLLVAVARATSLALRNRPFQPCSQSFRHESCLPCPIPDH